jgi:hypothetical protein
MINLNETDCTKFDECVFKCRIVSGFCTWNIFLSGLQSYATLSLLHVKGGEGLDRIFWKASCWEVSWNARNGKAF